MSVMIFLILYCKLCGLKDVCESQSLVKRHISHYYALSMLILGSNQAELSA